MLFRKHKHGYMSLIFGIIKHEEYDTFKVDHFYSMYEPLKSFPQEKFSKSFHNESAFGKILTHGIPEDVFDKMPVYLSEQNILFTAQGRIDNRDELARNLNLSQTEIFSDSYFMLQAYLKYGVKVQHHLKGDWSLAAYNFNNKDLFIARDTMGYTALYYYQTKNYFVFSSSIKSILNLPDFKNELNEEYYLSMLTLWNRDKTLASNKTVFKNVYLLPNACTLYLKDKVLNLHKYWPDENISELHYKNKQDYADEMLHILYNAVNVRLRSYRPVASMLSGGLDSSTVSYIAAELLKQQGKTLTTFSHVPFYKTELLNDPLAKIRVLDETPFIQAIVTKSGNILPQYLNSKEISPLYGIKQYIKILNDVVHAASNAYWAIDIHENCAKQGFGVLLTGEGGNGSISFMGEDYLMPHSLKRFLNHPFLYFKRQIAKPIALKYFNSRINKINVASSLLNYINDGYINEAMLNKYDIINELKKNNSGLLHFYNTTFDSKNIFLALANNRCKSGALFSQYYNVEQRDPSTDIDLMNYHLKLPNEVFIDEDFNNRLLVKKMMKNRLPDSVLFEPKKGLQSSDILQRVKQSQNEIEDVIIFLQQNNAVNQFIDVKKIHLDFKYFLQSNQVLNIRMQILLKTILFALFIENSTRKGY